MVEVAATNYKVFAYNAQTHDFSPEGTRAALSVMGAMDTPSDYRKSTQKLSIDETLKILLRETVLTGLPACELILNKARLPEKIQVVGSETLIWEADGNGGATPAQRQTGKNDPVNLDIPTFFYSRLSPDPASIGPRSMMEAAVKLLVYFEEFMEDIRRSVRVAGHNRMTLSLNAEKIVATMPPGEKKDPAKVAAYLASVKSAVESALASIAPEDAIVMFDSAEVSVLQSGAGTKIDYTPLLNVVVGQYATAMKSPPSVLGLRMDAGSQQTGTVETMVFLKSAKALHTPVETIMSRVLTLACRLLGLDVYIWFRFDTLDLRPEMELEAYRTMRETRLLNRLSVGFISDDEMAVELDCFPRPPGSPNLSGTLFMHGAEPDVDPEDEIRSGDNPVGRELRPKTPNKGGGKSQ